MGSIMETIDCSGTIGFLLDHIDCLMTAPQIIYILTVCACLCCVLGALLLPTIRGLTYGVLLVPVCMHSDYELHHNINVQFECADCTSAAEDNS